MADVVASSFGIITFGLQVGKRISELKDTWASIKSAPADIAFLLNECNRVHGILLAGIVQADLISHLLPPDHRLSECHVQCEVALVKLNDAATHLEQKIAQNALRGAYRVHRQRDTISKFKDQLETAKLDLVLAQQSLHYALSFETLTRQLNSERMLMSLHDLLQNSTPASSTPCSTYVLPSSSTQPTGSRTMFTAPNLSVSKYQTQKMRALYSKTIPNSWLRRMWHFQLLRAYGSWTFNFRTSKILDHNAPIVRCVNNDDLQGFISLLSSGEATIDDREWGRGSLLQMACWQRPLKIAQYLLTQNPAGLDSRFGDFCGNEIYSILAALASHQTKCDDAVTKTHAGHLFTVCLQKFWNDFDEDKLGVLERTDEEDKFEILRLIADHFYDSSENMLTSGLWSSMKRIFWPDSSTWSSSLRCEFAFLAGREIADLEVFWTIYEEDQLTMQCAEIAEQYSPERSLLLYAALLIVGTYCENCDYLFLRCRPKFPDGQTANLKFLSNAVRLQNLEVLDRGWSPLQWIIQSFRARFWLDVVNIKSCVTAAFEQVTEVVMHWIMALQSVGVDLSSYGQAEHHLFRGWQKCGGLEETLVSGQFLRAIRIRLINFTWGRSIEDWKFWFATSFDEIGPTFLLNHIPNVNYSSSDAEVKNFSPNMPGAWQNEAQNDLRDKEHREDEYRKLCGRSQRKRRRYLRAMGQSSKDASSTFWDDEPKREFCMRRLATM